MSAYAYANNDVAIISWQYDKKIPNCLGFCIERIDSKTKVATILPAWVGFANESNPDWKMKDTSIWPVQKFNWKDLTAPKHSSFTYRITPMISELEVLKRTTKKTLILQTNEVSVSPGSGPIKAYFNRGILSTQALTHKLGKTKKGTPNLSKLKHAIQDPDNQIRKDLMGELFDAVSSLLDRAMNEGGKCYCALYELTDPGLIAKLKKAKHYVEVILSNADGSDTEIGDDGKKHVKKIVDEENKDFRADLKQAGVKIYDRFVPNGHIGHNKFVVYENAAGKRVSVLSGSTNWTANGLCAQSNNAIIVEKGDIAEAYYDYWTRLKEDTENNNSQQSAELRTANNEKYPAADAEVGVWFSPNTQQHNKPKIPVNVDLKKDSYQPSDIKDLFQLMDSAEKMILFLEFQPGSPSVLEKALSIQERNKKLFIRGAATDPKAIKEYNTALFHGNSTIPDFYNVVAASAIKDPFSYWEQELLKAGHAIIHDKIVVIDPFTDNCVVATGSHNQGYKASYCNDENLLIIKGNKEVAAAYAAHIMDVYDHYRWRFTLVTKGVDADENHRAFNGLENDDKWQDKYFAKGVKAANKVIRKDKVVDP